MPKKIGRNKMREEWCKLLESLFDQIATWAEEQGWLVHKDEKMLTEGSIGEYMAPDMVIRLPDGRVTVDVIGRDIVGADGRVDLSAFPSFSRMLLVRKGDKWIIKTDSGVRWPRPWNKDTFVELAKLLATA